MTSFNDTVTEESKPKPKVTFGSDYVRITSQHQTVLRVVDDAPTKSWQHFVPKGHKGFPNANNGNGIGVMCSGQNTCPVCAWNKSLPTDDSGLLKVRPVYSFNVIDRTPVKACPTEDCGYVAYYENDTWVEDCPTCGADLTSVVSAPKDKVQIMQKGITVIKQLATFEQDDDLGDLSGYDVKFDTRGTGKDSVTTCIPKPSSESVADILGDNWKEQLYDVKEVTTPLAPADTKRILDGETFYNVVGKKDE